MRPALGGRTVTARPGVAAACLATVLWTASSAWPTPRIPEKTQTGSLAGDCRVAGFGRAGARPGGGQLVLCCPFGTALDWPSWAGPQAGIPASAIAPRRRWVIPARGPPLRARARPGPASRSASRARVPGRVPPQDKWAPRHRRAVPGAPPAAPRPGPRGPGPDLHVKWTSRAPAAPVPGRVFKSSGRRGLRSLRARTSSPSRVDVEDADASGPTSSPSRQPDAEPMLLVRGSPRHTDVVPTERAAQRVAALPPAESSGDHRDGARRGTASLPSGRHPAWSR